MSLSRAEGGEEAFHKFLTRYERWRFFTPSVTTITTARLHDFTTDAVKNDATYRRVTFMEPAFFSE